MRANIKTEKINKTTTNITLEHANTDNDSYIKQEMEGLFVLLGGYNAYARHVDYDTYKKLKDRFDSVLADMAYHVAANKSEAV